VRNAPPSHSVLARGTSEEASNGIASRLVLARQGLSPAAASVSQSVAMETAGAASEDEQQSMIKALAAFHWTSYKRCPEPTASRALQRLRGPLVQLMDFIVAGVLDDMRKKPLDPEVQTMGVDMLRALIRESEALKQIVLGNNCNVRVSLALRFATPILFEGLFEAMLARRSKGPDSGSHGPDFGDSGPGPGSKNN
jgi:hypothetical protein